MFRFTRVDNGMTDCHKLGVKRCTRLERKKESDMVAVRILEQKISRVALNASLPVQMGLKMCHQSMQIRSYHILIFD